MKHRLHHSTMFIFALLGLFFIQATSFAGALKREQIAPDAQWVAHFDIEGLIKSPLGQAILNDREAFDFDQEGIDKMKAETGIDPLVDIKNATFYGAGNPDDKQMIILVAMTAAVDQFVEKMKAEAGENFKEIEIGGYSVKSFNDGKETILFHVRQGAHSDDRMVVAGWEPERLVRAISIVEGRSPSLARTGSPTITVAPEKGSFVFITAAGLGWVDAEKDPASAVMKNAKALAFDFGIQDEDTYCHMLLTTEKAEDAANLADMARGLMAMGRMAAQHEAELAPFADFINSVKLTTDDNTIDVRVRLKTETFVQALEAAAEHDDEHDDDAEDHDGAHDDADQPASSDD